MEHWKETLKAAKTFDDIHAVFLKLFPLVVKPLKGKEMKNPIFEAATGPDNLPTLADIQTRRRLLTSSLPGTPLKSKELALDSFTAGQLAGMAEICGVMSALFATWQTDMNQKLTTLVARQQGRGAP